MKKISIVGSTGSIGQSTLQVVDNLQNIEVVGLAAHSNIGLIEQQAKKYNPQLIALYDESKALELKKRLPNTEIVTGLDGINAVASMNVDQVISAITGTLGLSPTMAAIQAGNDVALANKEALVSGGALVMQAVKEKGVTLLPIDSEHSAIFQCLQGEDPKKIRRIILTASGGPFRQFQTDQLAQITPEKALNHPTWIMGPKVTIDSSTLMNKGLEVIEAHWLFGVSIEQIEVLVHPQSIIHSIVEFVDSSSIAQMGEPKMITPIQYALTYPDREPGLLPPFDYLANPTLEFFAPDLQKFRCLSHAFSAIREGGSLPCYMNAANEVLVHRFLKKEISWTQIGERLGDLLAKHNKQKVDSVASIFEIDAQARAEAIF